MGNKYSHPHDSSKEHRRRNRVNEDSRRVLHTRNSNRVGVIASGRCDNSSTRAKPDFKSPSNLLKLRSNASDINFSPNNFSRESISRPTAYQLSSTYRRKLYADSLPPLQRPNSEMNYYNINRSVNTDMPKLPPLHFIPSGKYVAKDFLPVTNPPHNGRPRTACGYSRGDESWHSRHHQWNDNNWTEEESMSSGASCALRSNNNHARKTPKSIPQLSSLRILLEKFELEFPNSSINLRNAMEGLVDTDLLVGRTLSEQKRLLANTDESIVGVQSLLSKMHQHISHAHEFCNLLHRVDESLQTFSEAVCTVTTWEQNLSSKHLITRNTRLKERALCSTSKKIILKDIGT